MCATREREALGAVHELTQHEPVRRVDLEIEAAEEVRELHAAIAGLAADRQQLLILKFSEQLSNEEIATIMGRSEGAIKALLHRTVKGLRDELGRAKHDRRKGEWT